MHASLKNRLILFALAVFWLHRGFACGPWLPDRLLDNGGKIIQTTPEFYFELEVKQIAASFPSSFKAVPLEKKEDGTSTYKKQTSDADLSDFGTAFSKLELGELGKAVAAHKAMRDFILATNPDDATPPPQGELPGEFAAYHIGALAFNRHKLDEAQKAWEGLLALPAGQRQFRSTWAAFMLGKMAIEAKDYDKAVKWFRQVRDLVKAGFQDTLGLASSSLGWEAKCAFEKSDFETASRLYLEQFASGDVSAVFSLKDVASTAMPGATESDSTGSEDQPAPAKKAPDLAQTVSSPLTARIVTAFLLTHGEGGKDEERWLAAVEKAKLSEIKDADRLAWLAYRLGHFDEASRWLKHADAESGLSLWLAAKFDIRSGHYEQAIGKLSKARAKFPLDETLKSRELDSDCEVTPAHALIGDLGLAQVAHGELQASFQTFMAGHHWQDAAYIAERVMTPEELKALVDREYAAKETTEPTDDELESGYGAIDTSSPAQQTNAMRWLLARRLARLGRYDDARPYFPVKYQTRLDGYANSLAKADKARVPAEKAAALWEAAQIARNDGMELLGTELEPDAFIWGGEYEESEVAKERMEGHYKDEESREVPDPASPGNLIFKTTHAILPLVVPVTADEKKRLIRQGVQPELRFHYRYIAADIAWRAARLMPDNDEQTALVLNSAGSWLKDRSDRAADRFYQALEKRCPKTKIGRVAVKRHWFAPLPEPSPTPEPQQ